MKLIYIRSTMGPKNYGTIRSILKKEQRQKNCSLHFQNKWCSNTGNLSKITYEIYQEERKIINVGKRKQNEDALLPNKKQKSLKGKWFDS